MLEAGKKGLGSDEIRFELETITQDKSILFEREGTAIRKPLPRLLSEILSVEERLSYDATESEPNVVISLLAPLRIRTEGRTAQRLNFSILAKAAIRRISILNAFYGDRTLPSSEITNHLLSLSEQVVTVADSLRPFGFDRFSGRQKRTVFLDGILGNISFRNVAPELLQMLRIVEVVGLGKSTSFGFGRIGVAVQGDRYVTCS